MTIATTTTIFLDFGGTTLTPNQQLFKEEINKSKDIGENLFAFERSNGNYGYDCCKNCPNNPLNNPFASGFCNCVLPAMHQIRY